MEQQQQYHHQQKHNQAKVACNQWLCGIQSSNANECCCNGKHCCQHSPLDWMVNQTKDIIINLQWMIMDEWKLQDWEHSMLARNFPHGMKYTTGYCNVAFQPLARQKWHWQNDAIGCHGFLTQIQQMFALVAVNIEFAMIGRWFWTPTIPHWVCLCHGTTSIYSLAKQQGLILVILVPSRHRVYKHCAKVWRESEFCVIKWWQ